MDNFQAQPPVTLHVYWNYIFTPLFLVTVLFALFALFRVSPTQKAYSTSVMNSLANLRITQLK